MPKHHLATAFLALSLLGAAVPASATDHPIADAFRNGWNLRKNQAHDMLQKWRENSEANRSETRRNMFLEMLRSGEGAAYVQSLPDDEARRVLGKFQDDLGK